MIHSYAIKNYLSFHDRAEVTFKMTQRASTQGWDAISPTGHRLATALAVIGANGSGKTSLIKPLAFVGWFISSSFQIAPNTPIPIKPHFASPNDPTEFEIEADDRAGTLWRYVLRATPERVLHEALYRKNVGFSYVFVRDWDEDAQQYQIKQQNFGFSAAEAKKVRKNASLISTAAQYGVEIAQRLANIKVSSNLWVNGRLPYDSNSEAAAAHFFYENSALRNQMEKLLRAWDLGLSGVLIREVEFTPPQNFKLPEGNKPAAQFIPYGIHELADGTRHEIPLLEESNGTQTAFVTLWRLLSVLATGGVAVIDELENDMHPHMLEPLLDLFGAPETNPYQAQIIFTCHSAEVLNLLGKSQVYLVQKESCESDAWRLDSMTGVRSQDNLYAKYMSGAYGAVPNL